MTKQSIALELESNEKPEVTHEQEPNPDSKRTWPEAIAIGILPFCCILGGSVIAPCAALLPPGELKQDRAMLQIVWRFGPLLLELIALMPLYVMLVRKPSLDFTWTALLVLVGTQVMNFVISFGAIALSFHTVLAHVYMLAHLGGCFMVIGAILMMQRTHLYEKVGVAVALIGVIVMIMDPNIVKDGEKVNIIADLLTLGINLPWILYFLGSEYIKTRLDIEIIAFLGTAFMFFFSMIFSLVIEGTAFDASDDGIFGFFQPHNAYICFVWNAIFAGFFAFYGYNMALLYYPTVFVMNFLLVEPFIS